MKNAVKLLYTAAFLLVISLNVAYSETMQFTIEQSNHISEFVEYGDVLLATENAEKTIVSEGVQDQASKYAQFDEPNVRPVVFRVDLAYYIDPEIDLYNPSFMDLYVRGSFNGFQLTHPMEIIEDSITEAVIMISGEEGQTVEFKFFVYIPEEFQEDYPFPNGGWELLDNDPTLNRIFQLGHAGSTQDLGTYFFNNLEPISTPAFRPVEFFVDMSIQREMFMFRSDLGDEVFVRGTFNDSNFNDLVPLFELGSSGLFTTMFDIFGDEGEPIEYKFFVQAGEGRELPNGGWELLEGDALLNRVFELSEAYEPQQLPTVFFNDLQEVPILDYVVVSFSVDMSIQQELGFFAPEVGDIVYVLGTMNNDNFVVPIQMDPLGQGVYEVSTVVGGQSGAELFYKFFVDSGDGRDLPNGGWELLGDDPFLNRSFILGEDDTIQTLPTVFFNDDEGATIPDSDFRNVHFSVNMSVQQALGFFNPGLGDQVFVRGTMNEDDFSSTILLEEAETGIYEITLEVEGDLGLIIDYKFYVQAGDGRELPNTGWELFGDNPTLNRQFMLGEADSDQILPTVFFNDDEGIEEPQVRNVSFFVRMGVQEANGFYQPEVGDKVWVGGTFNDFLPIHEMLSITEDVYSVSIDLEGEPNSQIEYKFFITAGDGRELLFNGFEQIDGNPTINRTLKLGPFDEGMPLEWVYFSNEEPLDPNIVIVWPGDTNNDGKVDETDVLLLGLYWGFNGPIRENATSEWYGQPTLRWNPIEATFADTDGNGSIDQNDLMAIGLNFGETRTEELQTAPPIASETLPALQPGYKIMITLIPSTSIEVQGISYTFGVTGAPFGSYSLVEYAVGNWGLDWYMEGMLLEFDQLTDTGVSGARVHRGQTSAISANELFTLELEILQPIDAGAEFFVQQLSYLSETNQIVSIDNLILNIEVQTGTSITNTELPERTQLFQNYPNPFNPSTTITFDLHSQSTVSIDIVNILGQRVAMLANKEELSAGTHVRVFDARGLNSGVYLIRMHVGSATFTKKMLFVK